ncbi:MAG: hypothetical protein IJV41_06675 [Oscillospiraceae bacterium]|nr:hypothetical protein [Oscillospiraceae bacterium]
MSSTYTAMTPSRLRDLLDELEERLFDLEQEEPEAYGKRMELENLINNICELIHLKERMGTLCA